MIKFLFSISILLSSQLLSGEELPSKKATHTWVEIPHLKIYIAKPTGWHCSGINRKSSDGKKSKPTLFIVTAAKFDKTTIDLVPKMTVKVLTRSSANKEVNPELWVAKFRSAMAKKSEILMQSEKEIKDGIKLSIFRTLRNEKGGSLTSLYKIVSNSNTRTIYTYTLTSPTALWDEFFKKYGAGMVYKLKFDDEF